MEWMETPFFRGLVAALLVAAVIVGVWALYTAVKHCYGRRYGALLLLGIPLWGIGVFCKVWEVGPELLRYYVDDIGFPLVVGERLWSIAQRWLPDLRSMEGLAQLRQIIKNLKIRMVAMGASFLIALVYEVVGGAMQSRALQTRPEVPQIISVFDPWDVLCYAVGTAFALAVLARWRFRVQANTAGLQKELQKHRRSQPSVRPTDPSWRSKHKSKYKR